MSAQPQPLEPALVASGLRKSFDGKEVVCGISFELAKGEALGLLGPNGAGKTTTLGMLYGSVIPSAGTATLLPESVQLASRAARRKLGIITQSNNLDPDFSVLDNLLVFCRHYHMGKADAAHRSNELLALVGLTEYRDYRIDQLSGGLQRRLVLARALLANPSIVFLDEPTTGFDPDARQEFWKIIFQLKAEGKSILLTTHYMDEAERLCDRLLLMQSGKIVDSGTPEALIKRIAGNEIIEVTGIESSALTSMLQSIHGAAFTPSQHWVLPFGNGFLIPGGDPAGKLWLMLEAGSPTRLTRRKANLEDVFLVLTGARLGV